VIWDLTVSPFFLFSDRLPNFMRQICQGKWLLHKVNALLQNPLMHNGIGRVANMLGTQLSRHLIQYFGSAPHSEHLLSIRLVLENINNLGLVYCKLPIFSSSLRWGLPFEIMPLKFENLFPE
jgi:hypothetical protein